MKSQKPPGSHLKAVKQKVYDNCAMYSPEPESILIAHIPEKRAKWYLRKGLATQVAENPIGIRLNFPPKKSEMRTHIRANLCVVCGCSENLTRHHTVPDTIRKHLPAQYKSKVSHDILAVCSTCHADYELRVSKMGIAQVPLVKEASKASSKLQQIAKLLLSLVEYPDNIPETRRPKIHERASGLLVGLPEYVYDLFPFLRDYPANKELTHEQLGELQECHKTITGHLVRRDILDIPEFIFTCRKQFVDIMEPKFLPEDWDVFCRKWKDTDDGREIK